MSDANGKCDDCGRFMRCAYPATWARQYDFVALECVCFQFRCSQCTGKLGPAQSNARPYDGDMRPFHGSFDGVDEDIPEDQLGYTTFDPMAYAN